MKKVILFSVGGIVLAIALITIFAIPKAKSHTSPEQTASHIAETTIVDAESISETVSEIPTATESSETVATPATTEIAETEQSVPETKQETTVKTPKVTPAETPKQETGGITIGNPIQEQTYSCGVDGHHCAGPETHSYICELEQKGCEYCGSHSCPSFYATDEWGQGCYNPSKCPQYDIHKDPCCYCQTCGKKCGDGLGGTCVQFVIACTCPNCGEQVPSWTCHTCK